MERVKAHYEGHTGRELPCQNQGKGPIRER
jgi:hypothetical protein